MVGRQFDCVRFTGDRELVTLFVLSAKTSVGICTKSMRTKKAIASVGLAAFVFLAATSASPGIGQPGYLQGTVEQKNVIQRSAPPVSLPGDDDPFSNPNAGGDPFNPATVTEQPGGRGDMFAGSSPAPKKATVAKADPDNNNPELQVAWDEWHRRIAEAVFARFNQMSKTAFKYSEPLACKVSYTVTREGQVRDIKMLDQSPNMMFDLLVTTVLKSISGDIELLQFPEGSRRLQVEKTGTFTQNFGMEGFRIRTGDNEAVHGKGK